MRVKFSLSLKTSHFIMPQILKATMQSVLSRGCNAVTTLFVLVFLLAGHALRSQIQVASSFTACPNQVVTVNITWPNTQINNLTLTIPGGGSATNNGNLQTNTTFTISHPGPLATTWTLVGAGNQGATVVTSTVSFQLNIQPPPPLNITNGNYQGYYCPGETATIVADAGGSNYLVQGPQNLGAFPTNVILVPNLTPAFNGVYTITSVGSCTITGTTTIQVAPNNPLTVNASSNVCQGDTVILSAAMAQGQNWSWFNAQQVQISSGFPQIALQGVTVNDAQVYTVYTEQIFVTPSGNISCPRSATTSISVVGTQPVVPSASPSRQLCQGEKLSLSANAGANVSGFSWQGPCGYGPVSLNSPTISPVTPCNMGIYTVTAFFTNNFLTCSTTGTIEVDIIATAPPTPSVPITVCQNDQVTLSASGGTNVSGWYWFGPDFTAFTQNAFIDSIQPDASGPYVVTAVYSSTNIGIGTKTCAVSSQPQQLTVISVNSVTIIPPQPVCSPENAHLASSAPGALAYEWKGPNNFLYNGQNPTIYYPTPANSGVYTVTAFFGSLGCPNSNTVLLTVNPVLNFSLVPWNRACYNSSLIITGPAGADSYTWTSSTGHTSTDKDLSFDKLLPGSEGSYTLSINLGPCVTRAETYIEVIKPIQFTLTPKSRTLCQGDTTIFETGVTGGSGEYAYTYMPGLFMDSPYGATKIVVPFGTVQYNVSVYDVLCPELKLGHTFEVKVLEAPLVTLKFNRDRFCEGQCQWFTPQIDSGSVITTVDFGGISQYQVAAGDSVLHCLPAGEHRLKVTTVNAEKGCARTYEYPYPVIVDPRPGSSIRVVPEQPNTIENVMFYAEHKNDAKITYQSWRFQGGIPVITDTSDILGSADTTNAKRPIRQYDSYGKYPVMLVTQNEFGCFDSVVTYINVIDLFSVYIPDAFTPNGDAINDVFAVKGMGISEEGFSMDIFNRKGMNIFSTRDLNEGWDGTHEGRPCIDGVYTYKVRVVSLNGEGRKEFVGRVALIR